MSDFEDDEDDLGSGFDRRQFGKILVAGIGGLSLATVAGAQKSKARAAAKTGMRDFDVIIVGAGLSGLIAARELQKNARLTGQFKRVLILEANDRIGGRMVGEEVTVSTDKGPATGYIDYGGQWVGPTQTAMQQLLDELHLDLFISYEEGRSIQSWNPKNGKDVENTVFNGDVSDLYMGECKGPDHFPKDKNGNTLATCSAKLYPPCSGNADERRIWLKELLEKISMTVPCDRPWDAPNHEALDSETFQHFLDRNGAKDYTQWVPTVATHIGGSGGFEPDQASLLHMAWTQRVGPQAETPEKWLIKGGAGQIPDKLELALKDQKNGTPIEVRKSSPVTWIANDGDGVLVMVKTGSVETVYSAKAVIVAIPPPLRQKIDFEGLPAPYVGFMYGSPMGSMSKVHAVYDDAFWREDCLSGSATGNLETCEFIADSSSVDGRPGILTSFIAADRNVGLRHATKEQIQDLVLNDYEHFFGKRARTPKKFFYRNWNNQPWTGGAFTSYVPPGVWTRYGKEGWRKPFGLIFWAGTETSERWPGYFDGAIRAGIRAASEVLATWQVSHGSVPDPKCPDKVIKVT